MSSDLSRRGRRTSRSLLLLPGLAAGVLWIATGSTGGAARGQTAAPPAAPAFKPQPPTERIDVEQPVSFPYDI